MPPPDILRGPRVPMVAAPLFIVSSPDLVIAQCEAGIVGGVPAPNAREAQREPPMPQARPKRITETLDAHAIEKGADGPIAVAARARAAMPGCARPSPRSAGSGTGSTAPSPGRAPSRSGRACWPRGSWGRAMGADLADVGPAFVATQEADAVDGHERTIVDGGAAGIATTAPFAGVFGRAPRASVLRAGTGPHALPAPEAATDLGSGSSGPETWTEIGGAAQGTDAVRSVRPAPEPADVPSRRTRTAA